MARIPNFPLNEQARQLGNLASVLNLRGKPAEALPLLQQAQAMLARQPSQDPVQYSTLHFNLGETYALQQSWQLTEQQYAEGVAGLKKAGVSDRMYFFQADAGLGYVYWKTGRLRDAESRYEAALEVVRTIAPPTHPVRQRWQREYDAVLKELRP
jgi:tetratricopeptide (TPR) repeat protein